MDIINILSWIALCIFTCFMPYFKDQGLLWIQKKFFGQSVKNKIIIVCYKEQENMPEAEGGKKVSGVSVTLCLSNTKFCWWMGKSAYALERVWNAQFYMGLAFLLTLGENFSPLLLNIFRLGYQK